MMAKKKAIIPEVETVLVLRTCNADMTSYGGFVWPTTGPVEAPDWEPTMKCGHGLHGLLWGEGSIHYLDLSPTAKWLVFRGLASDIAHGDGDLTEKCKSRRGTVEYCGTREGAVAYLFAHGAAGKAVVFGTSTSGDRGTSTSGDGGTSTSGYRGTSTSGYGGTSTSGDGGTSTSGYRGTSTSGYGGVICILRWNGKRYKAVIDTVEDEDGNGHLEANTAYRLNDVGGFTKAGVNDGK